MARRAASGAGTLRQKTVTKNGVVYKFWEGRVTVGRDPGTGKQIRKSFTGKTQAEVRKKMQAAAVAVNEKNFFDPARITVGQWADIWLAEYCEDKKYLTRRQYEQQIRMHIKPALGAAKLAELTPAQIQALYNRLRREQRKSVKKDGTASTKEPLSAATVRNLHGAFSKCLNTAVEVGYIRSNPAERVTLPRIERQEIHPLDDKQVAAFYQAAAGDAYCHLLRILPFTGLRESEATGLTWDCVDFAAGTLTINKQLLQKNVRDGGYTLAPPKNGKPRTLKPAASVMQILRERQREQLEQRLKAGELWEAWHTEKERKTALVFTTPVGGFVSHQLIYSHCKKLLRQIGAGDRCVHDLRHTYAVLALQNGDDVKTVQTNLGHANAAFTLDVYGHVSERMQEESAERMEKYMGNIV